MNIFIPQKCKECKDLSLDDEENKYCCDVKQEYLTIDIASKCKRNTLKTLAEIKEEIEICQKRLKEARENGDVDWAIHERERIKALQWVINVPITV